MAHEKYKPTIEALAMQGALATQEQHIQVKKGQHRLVIGVPVEKELQEKRICLTPQSVGLIGEQWS